MNIQEIKQKIELLNNEIKINEEIEITINEILAAKKEVIRLHNLQDNAENFYLNSLYYNATELNMELTGKLVDKLHDLLSAIDIIEDNEKSAFLLENYNFKEFDTYTIWGYLED